MCDATPAPLKAQDLWEKRVYRLAWFLLVLGLLLVRFRLPQWEADLYPIPDALQYTASASNLAQGEGYTVWLNGQLHPARYPIGFPLSLVPVYWLGGDLQDAAWMVLFQSLLGLVVLALAVGRLLGVEAAFWTLFLVGFSPVLTSHATRPMSESLSFLMAGWILLVELQEKRNAFHFLTLGLLGGFASIVRNTCVFFLLPTVFRVLAWRPWKSHWKKILMAGLLVGVGFFAFLGPVILWQAEQFGTPFRTGYHYWHPERYENPGFVFHWRYAIEHAVVTWQKEPMGLLFFYARLLAGVDPALYGIPVFLLALAGMVQARRGVMKERNLLRLLLVPAALYVFHSFYYGDGRRFLASALPILGLFAAWGTVWLLGRVRRPWLLRVVLVCLVVVSSDSRAFRLPSTQTQLRHHYAVQYERALPQDAILITSMDPLYLEYFWRRSSQRQVVCLNFDAPHAMPIAPTGLDQPPGPMTIQAFRRWALKHGGILPVPVWDQNPEILFSLEGVSTRPVFLDLASHQRDYLQRFRLLGYQPRPLSKPGPRQLFLLQHPSWQTDPHSASLDRNE